MSEETTIIPEAQPEMATDTVNQNLQNIMWGDGTPLQKQADTQQQGNSGQGSEMQPETEIAVPVDWLKKEFEIEDPAILKAEREELRALKATPPKAEEVKFADDQAKQIYELLREGGDKKKEVLQILKTQEQLESIIGLSVDKDNAADIIKMQIKLKNKQLSQSEVEFEYKQNYEVPKEPVQKAIEDNEDFNERMNEWKEKVSIIETKRIIAAKMAQPELEKFKSELVLPEINKGESAKQEPTPEELEAFNTAKSSFLQSAKQTVEAFTGFSTQVKDKDVDFSVGYIPSKDEKMLLSNTLSTLAESGFDANSIFADRWYDVENKTFKIDQMTKDLSRMLMADNVDQKLAVDAANKRLDAYLAEKKNVNVLGGNQGSTFQPNGAKTESEKLAEKFFA